IRRSMVRQHRGFAAVHSNGLGSPSASNHTLLARAPKARLPTSSARNAQHFARDSGLQLLEDGLDGDHVPLEPELRLLEAGCDADQLRQVKNRQPEVAAGRRAELRLPGVE